MPVTDIELKNTAIDIRQFLETQFLIARELFMYESEREEPVIEQVHIPPQTNQERIRFMGFLRMRDISLHEHIIGRYNHVVFRGQPISMRWSHHNARQRKQVRRWTDDEAEETVQPKVSNFNQGSTDIKMLKVLKDQREMLDKVIEIEEERQNRQCQRCHKMEKELEDKSIILRMMHLISFKEKNDLEKKAKELEDREARLQAKSNRLEAWHQEPRAEDMKRSESEERIRKDN